MKGTMFSEKGQAIILLVFAMIGLLGFTALAIDGGMIYSERRSAQNAVDAAALAAARAKVQDLSEAKIKAVAFERAADNGYTDGENDVTVAVHIPPVTAPYTSDKDYIEVEITSHTSTAFLHFFMGSVTNKVHAIAHARKGGTQPIVGRNAAIIALRPTGKDTLKIHGTAGVKITRAGAFSNSSDPEGFRVMGNSKLTLSGNAQYPALAESVGGISAKQGGISPAANIREHVVPIPFPLLLHPPVPSSAPGTPADMMCEEIEGSVLSNMTVVGPNKIYCVNGDIQWNSQIHVKGKNVMFYMKDGDVKINGGAVVDLTAFMTPDHPYYGLLFYFKPDYEDLGGCDVTLNGNSGTKIVGSVFAPTCDVNFLGTGDEDAHDTQIIGYTVEAGGNNRLYINYCRCKNITVDAPSYVDLIE